MKKKQNKKMITFEVRLHQVRGQFCWWRGEGGEGSVNVNIRT